MHCYSPEKVGKDAGELAGLARNGVTATGTIEEIIAVFPDEDLTSRFSKPLQEACEKGGSTFYGTGMNPGLNQILGVVCSADVA